MARVWDTHCESHTQKLVLLALADNANDQGKCWPSIETVCRKCQLTDRAVQIQIAALKNQNLLEVQEGGGRGQTNLYFLFPENPERHSVNTIHPERHSLNAIPETPNAIRKTPNHIHPEPSGTVQEPTNTVRGVLNSVKPESNNVRLPASVSSSSGEKSQREGGARLKRMKEALEVAYKRKPGSIWNYSEESVLVEICKNETCEVELAEILTFRKRCEPRFFPHSVERLLQSWSATLDRARQTDTETKPEQESIQVRQLRLQNERERRLEQQGKL